MSPSFQITIGMLPARVPLAILDVRGEIDAQTGPQLEAAAAEAQRQGARHLVLDLSGVSFMGSAGMRALIAIDEMLRAQTGQAGQGEGQTTATASFKSPYLKLLSPPPAVARTLRISGFEMIFNIFSDRQAALDSFGEPDGGSATAMDDQPATIFPFDPR